MQKWEITAIVCKNIFTTGLNPVLDGTQLWNRKIKGEDKTEWEMITCLAQQGWELICVTPLTGRTGWTDQLLFTFKRPADESSNKTAL